MTRLLRLWPRSINLQLASVLQPLALLRKILFRLEHLNADAPRYARSFGELERMQQAKCPGQGPTTFLASGVESSHLQATVAAYNSRSGFALQRQRPRVTHRSAKISRMPKMLTWLLSLAVAAAASPPLNVTLTNNLLGVTTVRVNGAGLRVEATLGASDDDDSKEAGEVRRRGRQNKNHAAGGASTTPDRQRRYAQRREAARRRERDRHGGGAGSVARHVRPVDVAVGAPPAPLLRAARAAAAAAAEPKTRERRRHHHAGSRRMLGASGCPGRWICRLRPLFFLPSPF